MYFLESSGNSNRIKCVNTIMILLKNTIFKQGQNIIYLYYEFYRGRKVTSNEGRQVFIALQKM